jgi:hypothetical protein
MISHAASLLSNCVVQMAELRVRNNRAERRAQREALERGVGRAHLWGTGTTEVVLECPAGDQVNGVKHLG